ncbi:TPA: SoxR reducing system RseC family protein [Mannheimia haemolytica]|uniref:Sigma-E factor regulatory protein rseC n=1 Tax=Mannheimia haemolytica TaxID=75985 RepID=A0A378NCM8_MANHA|nr:SoxR reducing system RseC family protein [Mannheimia haemolytica]AGQ39659.1 sigma-E factor regulatory protein [Mannheimia haemolytica D171]AJE07706.1 transcriptional regulator [Mannheimia haemolytica USDA-ARS-USMARC-184]EEY10526.1 sigma E regulator RseC [Mannheimia haemolytica serotype A2 str. OVINE]EEY11715.1 sigma E regulator RseC [Mannheimia haemolytica serotype A2 str. BOVINE]EPY98653.1 sigma-E factor regulatory protein [Mannheimia haemolytica D35]
MMIEQATVVEYQNGVAIVQCYAKSSCGGCAAQSACGSKALSALAGEKIDPRFRIEVDEPLKVGDKVELGLAENILLKSVFLIYGIPLLVLVMTAVGFSQFFANELIVLFIMLLSTGITFWAVRKLIHKHSKQANFSPIFLGKVLGDYNGKNMAK